MRPTPPSKQQLQFTIRTAQGSVRIQATLLKGNQRMVGIWYDARGDDGFVLVRIAPASSHHTSSP